MQLQNKNKIAYLASLSLLFSYAEMLLPKILPFLRFGFGNIAILLALDLSPVSFFVLVLLKTISTSMISGTLFSPFFLVSLGQGFASAIVMYFLYKIFRKTQFFSIFGISLAGGGCSTIIQLWISSFYLGKGCYSLLGIMLIFSTIASLITGFFAAFLKIPENPPELIKKTEKIQNASKKSTISSILILIVILGVSAFVFITNNIKILAVLLILSFAAQKLSKRKILILPHIFMWIFVIFTSLIIPQGKVLYSIGKFTITQNALKLGIEKALKLSTVMNLSQCCTKLSFNNISLLSLTLSYFTGLLNNFRTAEGNIFQKLLKTLQEEKLYL